ncbi:SDR family NAD(P)-dependent oxidoreductase [Pseudonocardia sp.]|jgi:NAD(P)-dependent dehydrogenase (short-subunit alcohol dehydrogenase family)|uniref:SDR family NAD(P)-dependent oxidoreductase n=1 Tax=Pseudonocardia sp. TaxID=60912 RepID=UPI003BEF0167
MSTFAASAQPSSLLSARLAGQVCVVTAGNQGLGRTIATQLAAHGAQVAFTGRSAESLTATTEELKSLGHGNHLPVVCDVTDEAALIALADTVLGHFGRVDTVVANAGISGPTKPMVELTLAEWRETQAVNLDGVFLTFRSFAPAMIEQGSGSLIAIGSIVGKRPLAGRSTYAAAKLGVVGLVRTLAVELGPHGVRVNTICPGAVSGPRLDGVFREQARAQGVSEEEFRAEFLKDAPLRRMVTESEIGDACAFLASSEALSITGEDLNINAGVAMY